MEGSWVPLEGLEHEKNLVFNRKAPKLRTPKEREEEYKERQELYRARLRALERAKIPVELRRPLSTDGPNPDRFIKGYSSWTDNPN